MTSETFAGLVAIVGRPNVGKSTLLNQLVGQKVSITSRKPQTTRHRIVGIDTQDNYQTVYVDTPGLHIEEKRAINRLMNKAAASSILDVEFVLFVVEGTRWTDDDQMVLNRLIAAKKPVVLVVNKWDGLDQKVKEDVKNELDRRLGFIDFARVHFISALHGSGVGHLFESINEAYQSATRRTSTAMLTRIMQMAQEDHQPPMVNGRRVKLKYAHAGGYNPPRIVIHGNQLNDLPDSYKRYLINYFRKSLKIMGSPIRVEFQESANPFEGRKNTMTLSQERQRKRLLKAKEDWVLFTTRNEKNGRFRPTAALTLAIPLAHAASLE